ncbi:sugar transferase [Streptomyces actinomycinicus]|uniref:Sugar transferase n=1 Tax=Streptomyces actinomycinicus TaxID=1695166 RepID=A0A937EHP1_9ACTN|nr:sugar transferase [Streptomyces actinomycinicus]MBL1083016.1 sugar transferase [Streptomyces actinomycinicus]
MHGSSVDASRQAATVARPRPAVGTAAQVRRFGFVAAGADVVAAALPVAAALRALQETHAAQQTAVAALTWLLVGVAGKRYAHWVWSEGGPLGPLVRDWLVLLGVLALLRTLLGLGGLSAAVVIALLPSLLAAATVRKVIHRYLRAQRRNARALRRVLVVGEAGTVDAVVGALAQRTDHEYVVVGACTVGTGEVASGVPVRVRLRTDEPDAAGEGDASVVSAAEELGADLVLLATGRHLSGERLRRLSWALYDRDCPLMVLPGVVEVARRRIRLTTAAGLTLLHIAPPTRQGTQTIAKAAVDRLGALVLIAVLLPLFAALAVAVRLGSPGPAFYRQTRVGRDGVPFPLWKFRTMVAGADRMRAGLEEANENDGHMFKVRRDPRVTPLGRFLRRHSLDELPQLVNVVLGHMSLVGPRPPLPEEVARYDERERRRLTVKPGLTGLWQVSGRSDLSWHEAVSLDLRYVDNWSCGWDLSVLARTVRAVLDGRGAY